MSYPRYMFANCPYVAGDERVLIDLDGKRYARLSCSWPVRCTSSGMSSWHSSTWKTQP